jgi:hypothetical protein
VHACWVFIEPRFIGAQNDDEKALNGRATSHANHCKRTILSGFWDDPYVKTHASIALDRLLNS